MLRLARSGRSLLRIKGGDGYIFGRGGEEAQALAAEGIPFIVIPGITAAQGAAASVGIPLTHRDHAASLVLATGHLRDGKDLDMDWAMLSARARRNGALHGRKQPTRNLPPAHAPRPGEGHAGCAGGKKPRCPKSAASLAPWLDCLRWLEGHQVRPPALIIIGTVVTVRAQFWQALAADPVAESVTAVHALTG